MTLVAVEEDKFVARRATHHARFVLLARTFDEDLNLSPHERVVFFLRDCVHEFEQARVTLFDEFFEQLIRHRGGGCVFARRILEKKSVIELDFATERKSQLKVLLSLARETNDDVAGESDAGTHCAELADNFEIAFSRVASVHQLEQAITAALHGQMRALDEFG